MSCSRSGCTTRAFTLASAVLAASACAIGGAARRDGDLLPDARLVAIRDDVSSRREVLDWFGPPLVVATRSAERIPVPDVIGFERYGSTEVAASSFFEVFDAADIGPRDVVYFFRRHLVTEERRAFGFHHPVSETFESVHRDDRLWVLVDGATGVVKAHVHRRDPPPAASAAPLGPDGRGGGLP